MLSSNTTEERFHSTTSTEGRDLYLTEIISDIGEFSHLIDCHEVCGNNNEFSFVTNLLVLHATNAGKFRLNMNFPSLSPKRKQTDSYFFSDFFIIMHYLQNITLSTFTEITRNTK